MGTLEAIAIAALPRKECTRIISEIREKGSSITGLEGGDICFLPEDIPFLEGLIIKGTPRSERA